MKCQNTGQNADYCFPKVEADAWKRLFGFNTLIRVDFQGGRLWEDLPSRGSNSQDLDHFKSNELSTYNLIMKKNLLDELLHHLSAMKAVNGNKPFQVFYCDDKLLQRWTNYSTWSAYCSLSTIHLDHQLRKSEPVLLIDIIFGIGCFPWADQSGFNKRPFRYCVVFQ